LSFDPTPIDVTFASGETTSLNPTHPLSVGYAEILEDLRHAKIPAYVELDPKTQSISHLLIPVQAKVSALVKIDGGDMAVELESYQAHSILKKTNSQFSRLLSILEDAKKTGITVLVTDTDDHEIIDVRPWETVTTAHEAAALDLAADELSERALEFEKLTAKEPLKAGLPLISQSRLNQLFSWLASKSCNPRTVPPPCIPFLYPDDGCWGRAHEMARLITSVGNVPGKVWNYGNLRANTRNNPNCFVSWGYHVAPILAVTGWSEYAVVDPSMFSGPVPISTWKNAQQVPTSLIVCTIWQVFTRTKIGQVGYDPNFTLTATVLATYRAKLRLRSISSIGPPPYAKCK
jgi:hypothetical protein